MLWALAETPMFILHLKNAVVKKVFFNNLPRMSEMIFLVGFWVWLETHTCTDAYRLRGKTLELLVKITHN